MWANFRVLQLPDTDGIGCAARYDELLGKNNKSFRFKAVLKRYGSSGSIDLKAFSPSFCGRALALVMPTCSTWHECYIELAIR